MLHSATVVLGPIVLALACMSGAAQAQAPPSQPPTAQGSLPDHDFTHPPEKPHAGGGPGLHVHDTEEAHVLLEGSVQYRIGDKTLTVQAPYVARVPAGVPHTFMNVGTMPFNLIAVFASKHPSTRRIGPNPLIPVRQEREER